MPNFPVVVGPQGVPHLGEVHWSIPLSRREGTLSHVCIQHIGEPHPLYTAEGGSHQGGWSELDLSALAEHNWDSKEKEEQGTQS